MWKITTDFVRDMVVDRVAGSVKDQWRVSDPDAEFYTDAEAATMFDEWLAEQRDS